jgi:glycosyltransferase involved in cell wall biosynthesis
MMGAKTIFAASFDRDVDVRRALFWRPRWWPLYALGLLWANRIFLQNERQLIGLPATLRPKASIVPSIVIETNSSTPHPHRTKYVAWIAMLREPKRPDLLVEIASGSPDIRFIVCGGPTTFTAAPGFGEKIADQLRALPNVDYRGQVAPEEANRVIANAAILLSTAEEEGFPNTFLQAWACGTPVVSLRVDPNRIIEQHGLGRISPTVQHAINDIEMLLDSEKERESISFRAREYVQKYHTASIVINSFERSTFGERYNLIRTETSQTFEHQSSN